MNHHQEAAAVAAGGRFQLYVSDADLFKRWSTSRTIHRGYKFSSARYESEIKPLLTRRVDLASLGL